MKRGNIRPECWLNLTCTQCRKVFKRRRCDGRAAASQVFCSRPCHASWRHASRTRKFVTSYAVVLERPGFGDGQLTPELIEEYQHKGTAIAHAAVLSGRGHKVWVEKWTGVAND